VPRTDLILLHAPSIYDFRTMTILYGPISDLIPSSPIFELYPIGLTSIAEYLGRAGYRVRMVNLAVRMLRDPNFDAEKLIRSLKATVFGKDIILRQSWSSVASPPPTITRSFSITPRSTTCFAAIPPKNPFAS